MSFFLSSGGVKENRKILLCKKKRRKFADSPFSRQKTPSDVGKLKGNSVLRMFVRYIREGSCGRGTLFVDSIKICLESIVLGGAIRRHRRELRCEPETELRAGVCRQFRKATHPHSAILTWPFLQTIPLRDFMALDNVKGLLAPYSRTTSGS